MIVMLVRRNVGDSALISCLSVRWFRVVNSRLRDSWAIALGDIVWRVAGGYRLTV